VKQDQPRILVADDQRDVLEALRLLLKGEGFLVEMVTSPAGALEAIAQRPFDAVLVDLNYTRDTTSGAEGLDLVKHIYSIDPHLPVIVMTAWATIEVAVEAMRRGARDFVEKPWDNNRLVSILRNQVELRRALTRGAKLEAENLFLRGTAEPFIAQSEAMRPVVDLIRRVAPAQASVLVTGEPGTGKGLVARLLHELSPRAEQPFVSVNMGSIPETMFESEMFGHVKGAFTDAKQDRVGRFEVADGGTLFMDEIGNVPVSQQAKLLRVLERGEFERVGSSRTQRADVRTVSATNTDLKQAIEAGAFRKDLLFRVNTIEIRLPPLRERREDIPAIAQHYLAVHAQRYGRELKGFAADAERQLVEYPWPGNVRELAHCLERAVLMAAGPRIAAVDLRLEAPTTSEGRELLARMTLEDAERMLITNALARAHGNVNEAAEALGLSRSALYRRMEKFGL
jgi:DNA-binding NtrC family response regulator